MDDSYFQFSIDGNALVTKGRAPATVVEPIYWNGERLPGRSIYYAWKTQILNSHNLNNRNIIFHDKITVVVKDLNKGVQYKFLGVYGIAVYDEEISILYDYFKIVDNVSVKPVDIPSESV